MTSLRMNCIMLTAGTTKMDDIFRNENKISVSSVFKFLPNIRELYDTNEMFCTYSLVNELYTEYIFY